MAQHAHRTTDHHHSHHQGADGHGQGHGHDDEHGQSLVLDLDAEVFGESLAAVLDLAGVVAPRSVVDLGAGTGAGSRLLRERYPEAALTCVDNDPQMLGLLHAQGFTAVEANLDDGFPALDGSFLTADAGGRPADLVWASSSLHHVAHPAPLLSGIRRALAPGGVLVIVELTALPRFLSDPDGVLLEQRCHAAAAAEGWNQHPDWTPALKDAGFRVTQSEVITDAPVTPAAREYARQWFGRFAHLAALTTEDRDALDGLAERLDEHELKPRTTRTVWAASPA